MVTGGLACFGSGVPVLTLGRSLPVVPALASLSSNSSIKPCFANGAGSIPLRVKRSATEAKHFRALSETLRHKRSIITIGQIALSVIIVNICHNKRGCAADIIRYCPNFTSCVNSFLIVFNSGLEAFTSVAN